MQQNKDEVIKQGIQTIKKRLSQKQELLSKQEAREECMQRKMQNTKDDIEQLSYTLHELEKAQKAKDTRRVIPHDEILRFFTRFCHLFDDLQHRYHKSLKYWLTSREVHMSADEALEFYRFLMSHPILDVVGQVEDYTEQEQTEG